MVVKTFWSLIVSFLSLVKIIPGGKSTVVDRIALFLWTAGSVALSVAYLIRSWNAIELLCNQISVINLFALSSGFIIPCLNMVAAYPALYYLVSAYPHIVSNSLPQLNWPWLFLVNMFFSISAALTVSLILYNVDPYNVEVKITHTIYAYSLMTISSFIVGISASQIKTKIDKYTTDCFIQDCACAAEILQEFQNLKKGMSPFLFLTFSSKCIHIISSLTLLLTKYPKLYIVIIAAYHMMDLFYLTTVLDQTYSNFKAMTLKLR